MSKWLIILIIFIAFAIIQNNSSYFWKPKLNQTTTTKTEQIDLLEEDQLSECKNTLLALIATCQILSVILQILAIFIAICDKTINVIKYIAKLF